MEETLGAVPERRPEEERVSHVALLDPVSLKVELEMLVSA